MQRTLLTGSISLVLIVSLVAIHTNSILAQGSSQGDGTGSSAAEEVSAGSPVVFDNPLGAGVTYKDVVANVVRGVLGIIGVAALVMFIYGGIVWMTSLGNAERVRMGRDTLIWATLGLVVVFASFVIVNLILSAFDAAGS